MFYFEVRTVVSCGSNFEFTSYNQSIDGDAGSLDDDDEAMMMMMTCLTPR